MKLTALIVILFSAQALAAKIDPRIVGGDFAAPNQFPFQVALMYRGSLRCGASILSQFWCLTAAHCVASGSGV